MHPNLPITIELRAIFVRFLSYISAIGALSFFAAQVFQTPPVAAAIEPAPRPEWLTIAKPHPAFALALAGPAMEGRYSIYRHTQGGGRKDVMTFGEPGRSLHYTMVEIYRPGAELDRFADPAAEIAARSADLGVAGSVKASLPLDSKFGPAATVEFAVGRFGIGHCIGFVRAFEEPRLQIAGMSCSMESLVNRSAVMCTLDRLTLLAAGSDPRIAELFARAELRRTFCGRRDPLLAATPKREYHDKATPLKLRGRLSSR